MRRANGRILLALIGALVSFAASAGVGVWTTNGPPGGGGLTVVADPHAAGVLYAGTYAGIFRSADDGASWTPTSLTGGYDVLSVGADSTVYATGPYVLQSWPLVALLSSGDDGAIWQVLTDDDFPTDDVLAGDPGSANVLYLARNYDFHMVQWASLSRSTDSGASWTPIGVGLAFVRNIVVAPSASTTLYAFVEPFSPPWAGQSGLFKSQDSGSTWTRLPATLGNVTELAVGPGNPGIVYAGTRDSGVLKSVDGGISFQSASSGLTSLAVSSVRIDPLHPNRVYVATGSGVFASADGGGTWIAMSAGLPAGLAFGQLAIDSTGTHLHVASSGGVFDYDLDPGALSLDAAHPFTISLTATDQRTGRTGSGVATPVNDLWGYFSIPAITGNPDNPEVFVKMLDGTALNGSYWFFYGGLTNLQYTLTVTEDPTGHQKTYTNPAGSECGGSDTAAFTP